MKRVRLSPQARTDLDEIWNFAATQNGDLDRATRAIASIADKFKLFSQFPYLGKILESSSRLEVRTFPVGHFLIFYSVKPSEVRILRILHTRRDAFEVFATDSGMGS